MQGKDNPERREAAAPFEGVFRSVMQFIREKSGEEIDRAYEYFWEEEYPEDFLRGTALDIAFINFEDWLLCDYVEPGKGAFIDLYSEEKALDARTIETLRAMKESVISLYEVTSSDNGVLLKDLLLGGQARLLGQGMEELKKGDLFATRFIELDDERIMSRCVYPFARKVKDTVLGYLEGQFERYRNNKNPEGTMRQFLKEEAYMFNTIWVNSLFKLK